MRRGTKRRGSIAFAAALVAAGCLTDPATYGTSTSSGGASSSGDATTADASSTDASSSSTGSGTNHPSVRWAEPIGGTLGEKLTSLVVRQATRDTYIAGQWDGSMGGDWKGTMIGGSCIGPKSAFVGKVDENGAFGWGDCFGNDAIVRAITLDPTTGDILVAGNFTGQVDGWEGSQPSTQGMQDGFVARYEEDANGIGVRKFLRTLAWSGVDDATGIVAKDMHIFVTGTFEGTATSIGLASTFGKDIFLLDLDDDGTVLEKRAFAEGSAMPEVHLASHGGKLYLGGAFEGTMLVGGGFSDLHAMGRDAFVVTVSENQLTTTLANRYGGSGNDAVHGIHAGSDYVSIVGDFETSIDFGLKPGLGAMAPPDGFAALLHTSPPGFAHQRPFAGDAQQRVGATSTRGKISTVAGMFEQTVEFADGTFASAGLEGNAFAEKFDGFTPVWSLTFGTSAGSETATAIDSSGSFTVVGGVHDAAFSVGGDDVEYMSRNGTFDMFLVAIDD